MLNIRLITCLAFAATMPFLAGRNDSRAAEFGYSLSDQNAGCRKVDGCRECGCSLCESDRFLRPRATRSDWSLRADTLFLHRSDSDSVVLMEDPGNPARRLNAADFGFGVDAGWAVQLLGQRNDLLGWDARYMNFDTSDSLLTPIDPVGSSVRVNGVVPLFIPNVQAIGARYDSDLDSAEVNARVLLTENVSALAGFRYVGLDEQLGAVLDSGAQTTLYGIRTRNRLYGAQFGLLADLCCTGNWQIDGVIKAGVFGNLARHDSLLDTGFVTITASDRSNETSFVGELGVNGTCQLTEFVSLRIGYDLLWIDTVAVAGEQIPPTNFISGSGIDADDSVFYHGGVFGIELQL